MNPPSSDSAQPSLHPLRRLSRLTLLTLLLGVGLGGLNTLWFTSKADSSGTAPTSRLLSARPAQSDVSSATVCVKTRKGWNDLACASGVSIDPQLVGIDPAQGAVVLTNYHVIADMGNRPPLQLGGKGQVFNAEILRQSPEFDLALLFVPQARFPVAALAESSPGQGTAVRAIGFPNDQPLTVKNSALLGMTQNCLAVAPCLALRQGTITFGNSGGPLEANGRVIGITQGEIEDELAIPVEQIRQFLAGQTPDFTYSSPYGSPRSNSGFPPLSDQRMPPPYYPYPVEGPPPYYPYPEAPPPYYPYPMEGPPPYYPAW